MKGLRVGVTFIIVLTIFLLSVFQMQFRGYDKIGRVEAWTIYYNGGDNCTVATEPFYSDDTFDYYYSCAGRESLIIKSGFEEHVLAEAIDSGIIDIGNIEEQINVQKDVRE